LNHHRLGVACSSGRVVAAIALIMMLAGIALVSGSHPGQVQNASKDKKGYPGKQDSPQQTALVSYNHLPLIFEPNQGQSDPQVKFLARGSGYGLFLTAHEAVLSLRHSEVKTPRSDRPGSVLSMALVSANPDPEVTGTEQLPGKSNYFIGNDPAKWHRDIPQFARVRYCGVYPGIDLVFYGNQGRLEYDFELSPGSDPQQVVLRFDGPEKVTIGGDGSLSLALDGDNVRLQSPRIYQRWGEEERRVPGRFVLRGKNEVGFALGDYDPSRTLVIDPILSYSTYLGGSGDEACSVILKTGVPVSGCPAVAVDAASNAYIAGSTDSSNFPITASPYQSGRKGTANIFIAKFNNVANTLEFATYLGGSGTDTSAGLALDAGLNVIVAGTTSSSNFPTSSSAFQTTPASTHDHAFVSKLDPTGHTLLYSTYLSGNGIDNATGLAVDPGSNVYVTGTTTSTNLPSNSPFSAFPATLGAFQTAPASGSQIQFFMSKVDPTLSGSSSLAYSTYFGGGNPSTAIAVGGGIAVDSSSNVYITGGTNFLHVGAANDFPIVNAYQGCLDTAPLTTTSTTNCPNNVTASDAFVAKINPNSPTVTGTAQLLYSTYLGGTGADIGYGIAVDSSSAYVTGSTTSTDFPAAGTGVFQSGHGAGSNRDAFLAKLANPVTTGTTAGSVTLTYFTYIGGNADDVGLGVAVDSIQGARVTGWTKSTDIFPLNSSVQTSPGGESDAFVARIDTTATTSNAPGHYFSYLGGAGNDYGTSIAVDPQGASYVAGETASSNFPIANPFQVALSGNTDAFLAKLGPLLSLSLTGVATPNVIGVGNQASFEYTITNTGDTATGITFTDALPTSGASFTSASVGSSAGGCGTATGGIVTCTIGTLNAGATATATVVLTPTASITPATTPIILGNTASVTALGCVTPLPCNPTAQTSVLVNDFNVGVSPASATVPAGVPATYTATITPTGNIPDSVSVSCSSGLPTGATCTATTNPLPNLSNGPVSTVLVINTTARVTTTTHLWQRGTAYATWLSLPGLALLGAGLGGVSRKRRWLMGLLLGGVLFLMLFFPGCSSTKSVTTTSGTPAGTYVVTVNATSGSASRTTTVTLVVQ